MWAKGMLKSRDPRRGLAARRLSDWGYAFTIALFDPDVSNGLSFSQQLPDIGTGFCNSDWQLKA